MTLEALRSSQSDKNPVATDKAATSSADMLDADPKVLIPSQGHSMRMLILGAPGSGKGTISSRLVRSFQHIPLLHLSSGDLLRRQIAKGSNLGKEAKSLMDRGEMVHDNLMVGLIASELPARRSSKEKISFLLDGFPRSMPQAAALDQSMKSRGTPLNMIINLDVSEDVILSRIRGRIYNLSYSPPKNPGLDDVTGEPLTKRDDDKPEIFEHRLKNYRETTYPLLEYYQNAYDTWSSMQSRHTGVVRTFSGETSDEIFPQVIKAIEDRFEVQGKVDEL